MTRALVTGSRGDALCLALRERGWEPLAVPMITIQPVPAGGPLDAALGRLDAFSWVVVTSANGADGVVARARALGVPVPGRPRWAAVGPRTQRTLERAGIGVAFVPPEQTGAAIAAGLGDLSGRQVLLPRAAGAGSDLPAALAARGAVIEAVLAYETLEGPDASRAPLAAALAGGVEAIVFTSGSTVRGFARLTGNPVRAAAGARIICLGPATARAAQAAGLEVAAIAAERTPAGLVRALQGRKAS
ncbi:MAG: uroporphyrinogen-III synthase [Gemmatimonadota bacterium]